MSAIVLEKGLLGPLIEALPDMASLHAPTSRTYKLLSAFAANEVRCFGPRGSGSGDLGPFGSIDFPYFEMGAINSLHLFGLDELIIFAFYNVNRSRYRRVADIGANIGLHSIMMARSGYEVRCYEPDPIHFARLKDNLARNRCSSVTPVNAAVSMEAGTADFIRVLGNTTGSHLAGAKANPYGELERFPVKLESFAPIMEWADFFKMDIEGHEAKILRTTTAAQWKSVDAMIEVGTSENAQIIYEHLAREGVFMFSQKANWNQVKKLEDMPTSYREGSLFISARAAMPWGS